MARRRCISVDFYNNDEFLDLEPSTKMLYTYFILGSDDQGFIINPKTIMRICQASQKDFDNLVEKGLILQVDHVYVVTHWLWHDQIAPSKRHQTQYLFQKQKLGATNNDEYYLLDSSELADNYLQDDCIS